MSGQENPSQGVDESTNESSTLTFQPISRPPSIRFALTTDETAEVVTTAILNAPRALKLHESPLQEQRLSHFLFEPLSLPVSTVASHEDDFLETSRPDTHTFSSRPSSRQIQRTSLMHSPPITPAATRSREQKNVETDMSLASLLKKPEAGLDPAAVTPQISSPANSPALPSYHEKSMEETVVNLASITIALEKNRHSISNLSLGLAGESVAPSLNSSPPAPSTSITFSKPITPSGDINDPYAADKRLPQNKNLKTLDERFKFTAINSKKRAATSGAGLFSSTPSKPLRRSPSANRNGIKTSQTPKKDVLSSVNNGTVPRTSKHGSMSDLKRFFKLEGCGKSNQATTTAISSKHRSKIAPVLHWPPQLLPFSDDHGLHSKYGKFGKVLGEGAGGSVRLMKRRSDGKTFAVKEFRVRHSYETQKEYAKKVTAEFCIGSTLHHGNIIETLDIVCEKGKWYEVMEYAPYDLFATVMTGRMTRNEISCSFLQILSGVTYMHGMGLAHRDLKLDNVVVTDHGIMKIIDFGSASVFKYPFETGLTKASGIVGSDPYLAPEVHEDRKYDPQPTDIWSLAIIFCCMSLRRFPWKHPLMTDNSYKLFASSPTPGTEMRDPADEIVPYDPNAAQGKGVNGCPRVAPDSKTSAPWPLPIKTDLKSGNLLVQELEKKPEVLKGPWRLLRLLPRETRPIIGRMLEIDWQKRAVMSEILSDSWISGTSICVQEPGGSVKHAAGHTHVLEPPTTPSARQQLLNQGKHKANVKAK